MTKVALDAKALTDIAIQGLQEVKGTQIVRMDLRDVDGAITDFFVLCTGTSDRHVQSLAESAEKFIREQAEEKPNTREGVKGGEWILLDYVNVIVHIFQKPTRAFFNLEDLWGDAGFEQFEDLG
ncbi:MAG: ribosome silencing factor [Bacteroidota bacterium]